MKEKEWTISYRRTFDGREIGSAILNGPRRYEFRGGYGYGDRRPTREGCALIAAYMNWCGYDQTNETLLTILDQARAWHTAPRIGKKDAA